MLLASFGIVSSIEEGCTVLSLVGEIDMANAAELEEACDQLPDERNIIIDASRLDFIDCSSVGVLVALANRLPSRMVVARGTSRIQGMLFEMAGIDLL